MVVFATDCNGENLISGDCRKVVNAYNGKQVEGLIGKLVVVGNEPFTRLKFNTEPQKNQKSVSYRIVKDCSQDLWPFQAVKLRVDGKEKQDILETISGKKFKVLTLYPTHIEKVKE